jgi:hypothetical protein
MRGGKPRETTETRAQEITMFNEFALLFAVAAPVAVLFAMNLYLAWEGESGTLMLPSWKSPEGTADGRLMGETPANDPVYRSAA